MRLPVCSFSAVKDENRQERAAPGWWQRRIFQPIRQQMTQGISADRIALTLALGFSLGIFPILGSGFLLCGVAAWCLRLNQPLIQAVGTVAYPAQLLLLLPFYRAGEWAFQVPPVPLSIPVLLQEFFRDIPEFLKRYGMTGVRGIVVWAVITPPVGTALYFLLLPCLRRLAPVSALPASR